MEYLRKYRACGYILAGGASNRFGSDKALARFGCSPLVQRIGRTVSQCAERVEIVAAKGKYGELGYRVIEDRWPGEGPLGGIITALRHTAESTAGCDWNVILSCDMPFLTSEWLEFLVERAQMSKAQVVLPHSMHGPEPLCACYRTDAVVALQAEFDGGVRKVTQALKALETEVLDEGDWKRFDSAGRLFWNMNTAADYAEAQRMWQQESSE